MSAATDYRRETTDLRERIEGWAQALRDKDLEKLMSFYAPEALTFDLAPPLQHDRSELRQGLSQWFPTFRGRIGYEIRNLQITSGGDIAFCHSLNHLTGDRTDGQTTDVWIRATVCLRRIEGRWLIVHEHASVPFYMDGSFRAAVDLKP